MKSTKSFTLLEILMVIVIIGILASLGIVNYSRIREDVMDREATSNLKIIRAAEMSHRMDTGNYYPSTGSISNITSINENLKLSLPSGSDRNWNYGVWNTGCSRATQIGGSADSIWYLPVGNETPISGTGCP